MKKIVKKQQQKFDAFKRFLTPWKKSLKYSNDVKKIVKIFKRREKNREKTTKNDVFEAFFNVVKKKSSKNKNKKLTVFELFSRREKNKKTYFF